MSILTFPTLTKKAPTSFTFSLTHNTQTFESPLNKAVQTYELPGARWSFTGTWENITDLDARILKGWLAKLRGAAGRFYMWDMQHPRPAGFAAGSGTLDSQAAGVMTATWNVAFITADSSVFTADSSLLIPASFLWFQPGDYIGVGGELKMVTDSAYGSGTSVTISVEPPFRTPPEVGAAITFIKPTCVMRLVDDNQDRMEYNKNRNLTSCTISGIEVF